MNDEFLQEKPSPLTNEDEEFAKTLVKEYYKLPLEDLYGQISTFRNAASYYFPEVWEVDIHNESTRTPALENLKKLIENWLFILDDKVKEISITTSRGTVVVDNPDLIKMYFNYSIKKISKEYRGFAASEVYDYKRWIEDGHIAALHYYLGKYTSLKPNQILVVIGLFLVHFKIFRKKPLMTMNEYRNNPIQGKSYRHYLIDRVKPIIKTVLKKHSIDFSEKHSRYITTRS